MVARIPSKMLKLTAITSVSPSTSLGGRMGMAASANQIPSSIPSSSSFILSSQSRCQSQSHRTFHTSSNLTQDLQSTSPLPGSSPSTSTSSTTSTTSVSSFRSKPTPGNRLDPNRPHHRLHVQSTRNNTILTLTTPSGDPLSSSSGGTAGFKKAQRSGYEAAYRAAFQMFNFIQNNRLKWGLQSIEIIWKGFGQGREAVFRALMAQEGQEIRLKVAKMTDSTPIKIGGVRPKKRRML